MIQKESFNEFILTIKYTRNGNFYYKEKETAFIVFQLQKSKFSDGYYLNIGVYLKEFEPFTKSGFPKILDCHFQTRLLELLKALELIKLDCSSLGAIESGNYLVHEVLLYLENELSEYSYLVANFPDNIPVIKTDEVGVDFIHAIHYGSKKDIVQFLQKVKV